MKNLLAATLLLACAMPASAATFTEALEEFRRVLAEGKASTVIGIDNDSLLLKKDDGFYTSGLRLTREFTLRDSARSVTAGWHIGQEQYTASDVKLPPEQVGPPDHPYAAWLFAGMFKETRHADGRQLKFGLDVGCLGPCVGGEWTQKTLHRLINQPMPQAWSKQVRNEVGVVLHIEHVPLRWTYSPSIDLTPNLHARFGNIYTDAGAGLTARAGRLNQFPDQDALFGFARIDARAVGYNASLQGGYFSSGNPHTVTPKRVVGEAELGLIWRNAPYAVHASIIRRGNEIDGLPNSIGAQNFARLQFSYAHY